MNQFGYNPDRMYKNAESETHFINSHMSGFEFKRTRLFKTQTRIFINFKKNIFNINRKKKRAQRAKGALGLHSFTQSRIYNRSKHFLSLFNSSSSNQIVVVITCPPSRLFIIIISHRFLVFFVMIGN